MEKKLLFCEGEGIFMVFALGTFRLHYQGRLKSESSVWKDKLELEQSDRAKRSVWTTGHSG